MLSFYDLFFRLPTSLVREVCETKQDPIWHKEGTLNNHLSLVYDEVAKMNPETNELYVCAIFHDLGKLDTCSYEMKDGLNRLHFYGHEKYAEKYIDEYIHLYDDLNIDIDKVREVCRLHMYAHEFQRGVIRNHKKIDNFRSNKYYKDIMIFAGCDNRGRKQ